MNFLKSLSKKPVIGGAVRYLMQVLANQQAKSIANHFSEYLQPTVAMTESEKEKAFAIRHDVYCEELKFEPLRESRLENDEFDKQSIHCLIQHRSTEKYAGTVRMVCSNSPEQLLPIEKYCLDSIDHPTLNPNLFKREEICEISRLAVPSEFRRRQSDKFKGAATGAINETVYSERELRCFPFIAVGLYLSAASVVMKAGVKHVFVMMEPRLARSLKFVGIEFEQIGPVVDYHGKRAPYYIDPYSLHKTLSPGFQLLFKNIINDLSLDNKENFDAELIGVHAFPKKLIQTES
ncbi:PEP-CTERM/exosortase system-associated acyltransferase [Psychrosphaera aestuarii]|uniref:PEP-CTERM/exosortase system-associated acyltransferase n=1 Tax=Psychrosphaera aestuarii TaxID=1266052 RepID=UPI001B32FBE3|nr:PEP-CTERM/exosortase system-associated acyltransferase [Psychrosphaera aestuarii]